MRVTITKDHLNGNGNVSRDETGDEFSMLDHYPGPYEKTLTAEAYDDDGEHYYTLSIEQMPAEDPAQEACLEALLTYLQTASGVTTIRFPRRKDLNVG